MTASERIREARMAQDETYNGWSNYPTWAVNLWLSNDRALYEQAREMAGQAAYDAPEDDNVSDGIWTVQETARFRLADTFKEWVVDDLSPDLGATFAADLLGYALGEVDWHEIADAWLEDVSAEVDS